MRYFSGSQAGCPLASLTKLLRIPLSRCHLKSIKSEFLGEGPGNSNIYFNSSLGDSIMWLELRITVLLLQAHWESLQWSSLLTIELCQGHAQTSCQMAAGYMPRSTELSRFLPATKWPKLNAEPHCTFWNLPDDTSFLKRILLNWVENHALDESFVLQRVDPGPAASAPLGSLLGLYRLRPLGQT